MAQLHTRFTDEQVRDMLKRYLNREIERPYLQSMLGIGKSRFFSLLHHYRAHPDTFSIQYHRPSPTRLDPRIEQHIVKELTIDQQAIQNPQVPLRSYNYSYVRQRLQSHYRQTAALSTIIARAKQHGFYLPKRPHTVHDREVLTRYVGELIQHDSSHHLWAPAAGVKWYLLTSLDDFSRYLFFAKLVVQETVWMHIDAVQRLVLRYGYPYAYYVDCHAIFRFVRGRDALHVRQVCLTDDVDPQWKQTLRECGIKPIYALSPQAKGKIERPYRWLQDHLVRTCVREDVASIATANQILAKEVHDYNYCRVHSTTAGCTPRPGRSRLGASSRHSRRSGPSSGPSPRRRPCSPRRISSASASSAPRTPIAGSCSIPCNSASEGSIRTSPSSCGSALGISSWPRFASGMRTAWSMSKP